MRTFALHAGAGFLLLGLVCWQPLTAGLVGFVFGWLREQSYEWGQYREARKTRIKDGWGEVSDLTFLDTWWHWQTPHKLWEALQWGIGGQAAGIVAHLLV